MPNDTELLKMWGAPSAQSVGLAAVTGPTALLQHLAQATAAAAGRELALFCYRQGCVAMAGGLVRDTALHAYQKMQQIADELDAAELRAMALGGLALVYDSLGQRQLSLQCAEAAGRAAAAAGNQRLLAFALNHEGQYYKETGRNPQAAVAFQRILEIGLHLGDQRLALAGHIGLGRTTPMATPEAAKAHYAQAMALAVVVGDLEALSVCRNNLADWQIYGGDYAAALSERQQSLALCQKTGSQAGVERALLGMAKAHTLLGNLDQAWLHINQGLPLVLSVADLEGELHGYLNLAYLYAHAGDVPRACDYYQRTLEKSLAAPDAACALFAQDALQLLAQGVLPQPGIAPQQPVALAAGGSTAEYVYPTGDRVYGAQFLFWNGPSGE